MSGKKTHPPRIPAGAPGHPRESGGQGPGPGARHPRREARPGSPRARKPKAASPVRFIYEDDELIAVDKPSGLPVIAPEGNRGPNLYDIVTEHLRRKDPRARAAVVHRIDRDTSGIVVFAKSGEAKRLVMGSWNELVSERRYAAIVEGRISGKEGLLDSWMVEESPSRVRAARPGERGALRAVTHWRLVAAGSRFCLLELELETGRRHQIRVQLAGIGHPVAGDRRYGATSDPLGRLCLHAQSIEMTNPLSGERFRLESPCPPEFRAAVGGPEKRSAPRGSAK